MFSKKFVQKCLACGLSLSVIFCGMSGMTVKAENEEAVRMEENKDAVWGAKSQEEEKQRILFVGDEEGVEKFSYLTLPIEENVEEVVGSDILDYTEVMIATSLMSNDNQKMLVRSLEKGTRILILGEVSKSQIENYFGSSNANIMIQEENAALKENFTKIVQAEKEDGTIENIRINSIGKLIYQDERGQVIVDVYVQDIDNKDMFERAIQYVFRHDYLEQTEDSRKMLTYSGGDYVDSWTNIKVYTHTYILEGFTATAALRLYKYANNPNASGQYLGYIPCTVEIEPVAGWAIKYAEMDIKGATEAKIYDWGPEEQTTGSSGSVTINFLDGLIGVSLDIGTKVKITKEEGGIDSTNLKLRYQPKNLVGVDMYCLDTMTIGAFIETYQSDTSVLRARGSFSVKMGQVDQFGESIIEGMKYTQLFDELMGNGN